MIFFLLALLLLTNAAAAEDPRVVRIEKFLARHAPQSPLRNHSREIVSAADKYKLDWRLYVALAGAESTWGKRYPKKSYNLTGISNGRARFKSIAHNIQFTYQTIALKKWYRKYRKTKRIEDLVYVYKGVPPYDRYIRSLKYTFDVLGSIPIPIEKKITASAPPKKQADSILALNQIRFDRFATRSQNTINLSLVEKQSNQKL